jgi:translation initiation factor 1
MSTIENLKQKNPFDDTVDCASDSTNNTVHIRLQQRNGRKCITTIQGLSSDIDLKRLQRTFKKTYATSCTIIKDPEFGEIIQLCGDHRHNIFKFLVDEDIVQKTNIKIHGT